MKKSISASLFLFVVNGLLLLPCISAEAQNSLKESNFQVRDSACPPEGNAKNERIRELNKLKNRKEFPGLKDFDTIISLQKILQPGKDLSRWNTNQVARIKGYVYEVKSGGTETCNCKATEKDLKDTHIEIILDPMNDGKIRRMIVEITPGFRKIMKERGMDWSTSSLRDKFLGRWVQVEGWMFYDEEHAYSSENSNPGNGNNWRGTAWEIHPVTKLEVIDRPR
jgi:hypothetical protein